MCSYGNITVYNMTFIITFFRKKRDDFAKIAALDAVLFDRTLRFFLPGKKMPKILLVFLPLNDIVVSKILNLEHFSCFELKVCKFSKQNM